MTRYSGLIVAVVGLLVTILGATGLVPYVTWTGVGLIFLGGLLIGLSFIPQISADEETDGDVAEMSAFERLTKIFYAPAEVFQNLRRHPRWFVAVLVMTLFSSIFSLAFYSRVGEETIVNYTTDKTKEMSMIANNPEALASVESGRKDAIEQAKSPIAKAAGVVSAFMGWVFIIAVVATICWLFALAMGGKMGFWQAFSAVTYAYFPVVVIHRILSLILLYLKDPSEIHPILGQSALVQDNLNFLVSPAENPALYVLLGAFSLLMFYWIFLLATGMKHAGTRVSATTGWTTAISLYVVYVLFMLTMALLFPSFMS